MVKTKTINEAAALRVLQVMRFLNLRTKGDFAAWAGRSQSAVSDWFTGKTPIQIDIALRLKEEKKISLDWLYAGDDSGQAPTVTQRLEDALKAPNLGARPVLLKDRRSARRRRA